MACSSCGKKTKKIYGVPDMNTIKTVREVTVNRIEIMYTGIGVLRLKGCSTRNIYLFKAGRKRLIDENDVVCFMKKHNDLFEVFADGIESDNSKNQHESDISATRISESDE